MKPERRTDSKGPTSAPDFPSERPLRKPAFLVAVSFLVFLFFWTYSNHFENEFQFDDSHTIVNNNAIRKLGNIPYFFSDSLKSSTLPANQAWRPGLVTLNTIDYAIQHHMDSVAKKDSNSFAGKIERTFCPQWWAQMRLGQQGNINPFWFHVSIFSWYIVLGIFLFFFLLHIFRKIFPATKYPHWAALIGTGLFMLHTANAETINYIISRDDSFSTMMVLFAFVLYFYSERARKYFLFLLPVFFGYFVKEPTIMFAPMLLVYIWLFGDVDNNRRRVTLQIVASFLLAMIMFAWSSAMTPEHHNYGGGAWYLYLATQTFVIVHYIISFFLPFNLSADTDWVLVRSIFDDRAIAGLLIIVALLILAWKLSKKEETKAISFGILWFFIALVPTSIFPLSEVLNDHRPFFAYIGLVIVFGNAALLVWKNADNKNVQRSILVFICISVLIIASTLILSVNTDYRGMRYLISLAYLLIIFARARQQKEATARRAMFVTAFVFTFSGFLITLHALGTHHRNVVWHTGESLWKDVTEKSPGNGRGWMNYGLALMKRGSMDSAINCFQKALDVYPNYSYANINMGIAQSRVGNDKEAETFYQKAINNDPYNPECYYFYGLYLVKMQRGDEAIQIINKGLAISPAHEQLNILANSLKNTSILSPVDIARQTAKQNPTPDNYINLSLALYNANLFRESAQAAKEAMNLDPNSSTAYNNICAAYNRIGEFDSASVSGKKAVELAPNNQLFLNNYLEAQRSKLHFDSLETFTKKKPAYDNWINLSLAWYKAGNYKKSMIAAEEATMVNPKAAVGWNNICAAANLLGDYERAVVAGEKAVQLDPNFELAKNNLASAKKGLANQKKK